jgi:nicotinamide mononucleotide (NMN) deamidase PncC
VRKRRDGAVEEIYRRFKGMVWGIDNETWATVLARLLANDNRKLGIIELGTGGAFSEILARDLDATDALAEAKLLPLSLIPDQEDAREHVARLAVEATELPGATVGHATVLEGAREPDGLFKGRAWVATAVDGQPATVVEPVNLRSTLPEVQRRAALHAVDCLRKFLAPA